MSPEATTKLVGLLVAVLAVVTLAQDAGGALAGKVPQLGRCGVALLGLAAAALLASGRKPAGIDGRSLTIGWAAVQLPLFAWSPDGSPNVQALPINLGLSHQTRVDGVLTSYGQYGINLTGAALLWIISRFVPRPPP